MTDTRSTPGASRSSASRRARSSTARTSTGGNGASAIADSATAAQAVIRFGGDCANELADWLHMRTRQRIQQTQDSLSDASRGSAFSGTGGLIASGARYLRHHPWRATMMLALIGTAAVLAYPEQGGRTRH